MRIRALFSKALALATIFSLFTGCNEEARRYVGSIEIVRSFTLQDKDGQAVQFRKGQSTGYGWSVILGTDNQGRRGIALTDSTTNRVIPFAVTADFALGQSARVPASVTGQGVAIVQELEDVRDGSRTPTTTTESCENVRTETICDRIPGQPEHCHERTITSSGTRQVTITPSGSIYDYKVTLKDAKNNVLATFDYSDDLTFESRDEGPCY